MDEVITPEPSKRVSPSKLMGTSTPALGQVGQGGESKVGKLARIVRTTRVKVNKNEKDIKINIDKLMNVEDEQEQIHESIFNLVEKQADSQKGSQASESIEKLSENLNTIAKELASISGLLNKQLNTEEKQSKALAAAAVNAQRREREKRIESGPAKKEASGILDVVKKPMGNFFDMVKRFLGNIIAGGAVLTLLKWLNDPKNQEGIAKFVDFFTENLPQILLKALGILTSGFNKVIGNFINLLLDLSKKTYNLLKSILKFGKNILKRGLKFVKNLGKGLIDQITKATGKTVAGEVAEGAGKEGAKQAARSNWLKKMFEPLAKAFPKAKGALNSAIPGLLRRIPFIGIGIDIALNKGLNGQDWTEAIVRGLFSGTFGAVGAVAGAKAGGAIGGTIGLALGGIGAIPGAVIGAGLGGLLGGIAANYLGDMTGEKVLQSLGYETTSGTTTTTDTSEGMGATPVQVEPTDDAPSLDGYDVDFSEGMQEAEDVMAELSDNQTSTEAPPAPTLPPPEKPPTDFMAAMQSTGVRTLTGPDADEANAIKYDMNKAKSSPDMFSRRSPMIYNLPSVKMDDEIIYVPHPADKKGGESASTSPGQKNAPMFSSIDPMNISFASVISIYNTVT